MRTESLWISLSLVVVGCTVGHGTPSEEEQTNASTSSALTSPAARKSAHPSRLKNAVPLAFGARNPLPAKGGDPGDDDTAISLDPALSALCQSYLVPRHRGMERLGQEARDFVVG
jgi:hypothetical protein